MTDHPHRPLERFCDVAIIGGSAAGLAAALQLTRQRRSVIVIDDGTPRNAPASHVHGYLGREGTPPTELTALARDEVRGHGGEILAGRAIAVRRSADDRFRVELTGGHALLARRVLAATGLIDELPDIEGVAEHWGRDVIHCPFCHGDEVRDRRIVQIVTHPMGLHPAPLFRHLSSRFVVVLHEPAGLDAGKIAALAAGGTEIVRVPARRVITGDDGRVSGVELWDGRVLVADAVVVGPTFRVRAEAFAPAGVTTSPHRSGLGEVVEVDPMGQTRVPGIFAAGNVTDPGLQVLHAAAHGSRVGAAIAFSLAEDDLRAGARPSGDETDWDQAYAGDESRWSGNPNGTLVHEVTPMAPGRALDIGAGEGGDAIWLAGRGWQVTATDISSRALARLSAQAARQGLHIECRHVDANAPDAFGDGAYDLVSMQYGSIHRTPDRRALRNLLDAVAPGGPCSWSLTTWRLCTSRSRSPRTPGCTIRTPTSGSRRSPRRWQTRPRGVSRSTRSGTALPARSRPSMLTTSSCAPADRVCDGVRYGSTRASPRCRSSGLTAGTGQATSGSGVRPRILAPAPRPIATRRARRYQGSSRPPAAIRLRRVG